MSFRTDINDYMKNVQVDNELKNSIYENTVYKKNNARKSPFFKSRFAAVVLVGTLLIGTIAVTAADFSGLINIGLAKYLRADQKMQRTIIGNGYVDNKDKDILVSTSKEGIKIDIIETIIDEGNVFIHLHISSTNNKDIGEYVSIATREVNTNDINYKDMIKAAKGQCLGKEYYNGTEGVGYLVKYNLGPDEKITRNLNLHLSGIICNNKIYSDFDFCWKPQTIGTKKEMKLEHKWTSVKNDDEQQIEATFDLKSISISPFSMKINYDCNADSWNAITEKSNIKKQYSFGEIPITIIFKNGEFKTNDFKKIIKTEDCIFPLSSYGDNKEFFINFSRLIDTDEIDYIEIGEKKYDFSKAIKVEINNLF